MFIGDLLRKPKFPAAVVIPMYKSGLDDFERIALKQCIKVLGKHPTFVVAPKDLTIDLPSLNLESNVNIVRFDSGYFSSKSTYNKLLLSPDFYRRFLAYEYILIYQLDAFAFRDELLPWCARGFDYVGAPWIGEDWPDDYSLLRHLPIWARYGKPGELFGGDKRRVGNGGFSLRKVRTFAFVLSLLGPKASEWPFNEDLFWGIAASAYYPFFKKPTVEVAIQFSFELQPKKCFEKNSYRLPFGCHAWWSYNLEFWRPIFSQYGYRI